MTLRLAGRAHGTGTGTGIGIGIGVALTLVALATAACGQQVATPSASDPTPEPSEAASAADTPAPVSVADLARAVVQIVTFVDGEPYALGSGTIVSAEGLILTNAHVITADEEGVEIERIEIGITDRSDSPPEPTYEAEVEAADGALDLAILRITGGLEGVELPDEFPYVSIGDSEALEIGDPLRILGYPGIGGETITLTSGEVSGFVSEAGLGRRAWIKTDATIAGGNSGGLAANADGEIVAVPTVAGAGSTDEVVDCRPVRDTNRDGVVDDADDCVPIGGFLNGLRPIALAQDMLDAVTSGVAYAPIAPAEPEPSAEPGALDDVAWGEPVFASDVSATDEPIDPGIVFEPSAMSLCAFWDYEGMAEGMAWSAEWWVDGTLDEGASFLDQTWSLAETGSFWVCLDNEEGIGAGLYDVVLLVEGEVLSTGFVHVGADLVTTTVTVRNDGPDSVCYLFASPLTSTVWGPDHLGETEILSPGASAEIELVAGEYDFRGDDCEFEEVLTGIAAIDGAAVEVVWDGAALSVGGTVSETELVVGDCFTGEAGWDRATTDLVPCDEPHQRQIVGLVPWTDTNTFPGEAALEALADEFCLDAFEDFVGISYESSIYFMSSWTPTAESWDVGDRMIVCALELEDDSLFTGSRQGAGE